VSHHDETLEADHPASAGFPVLRDDVVVIADAEPVRFFSRAEAAERIERPASHAEPLPTARARRDHRHHTRIDAGYGRRVER
jgi:hypothetical protein